MKYNSWHKLCFDKFVRFYKLEFTPDILALVYGEKSTGKFLLFSKNIRKISLNTDAYIV